MKKNVLMGAIIASMMMLGCGSSDNDDTPSTPTNAPEPRFSTKVMMGDTMEIDSKTNLVWVGSAGTAGGNACIPNPNPTDMMTEIATAKDHCDVLVFGGHDDWRVPTVAENIEFITDMKSAGKTPFYRNAPCPRLIGVDGTTAMTVNTHNVEPVAGTTDWTSLLEITGIQNFGVKCVRNK